MYWYVVVVLPIGATVCSGRKQVTRSVVLVVTGEHVECVMVYCILYTVCSTVQRVRVTCTGMVLYAYNRDYRECIHCME